MKTKIITKGEVTIVKIEGAIKSGDEYELAERMEKYIKPDSAPKFIVDMKKVPFINSAALGLFLNIFKHVDYLKGRMVFAGLNSDVENLMEITKLSSVFEIFKTVEEALESFDF
ncbi:MAG: STAS domain-containing protein [Spirochaetia bacterium]|jgi:anti-sigma B factor antagonist|nr:STAS domain-containing protein [Leptospirales bacterium]MCE9599347.1 STAS domain-containing protein [Spirochaetia bacterium]